MNILSEMLSHITRVKPEDREVACRVLVIGGEAELPHQLGELHPQQQIVWIVTDVREQLRLAGATGIDVRSDPAKPLLSDEQFDTVLLPVPRDRRLSRRWLMLARQALADDGTLAIVGANAEGIKPAIADAKALFGAAVSENYAKRHRVARFTGDRPVDSSPEWATQPGIAPGSWDQVDVDAGGDVLLLATLPGVFAGNRLDEGTSLLHSRRRAPATPRQHEGG